MTPDELDRLRALHPTVSILALLDQEPELALGGPLEPDEELSRRARAIRHELRDQGGHPSTVAVVIAHSAWDSSPVRFDLRTLDYAEVRAVRERDGSVPILNAMVIAVAPERRTLVLHRRASNTEILPGALHGIGGSYDPPAGKREHDRVDLRRTAMREVDEELGLGITVDGAARLLLREDDIGSYLMSYLGCRVTSGLTAPDVDEDEGCLHTIPFDRLETALAEVERWAPSGHTAVLAWLVLGAPGSGEGARFGGATPRELFDRVIERLGA